ncbi:AAA family ATPase [Nocardia callitridis]|uniref:Phosphotransferase n=1 Tax=Nocardia callitridis TaxID=648753 RepID=A0ABP9K3U4_9NOCA
MTKAPIYLITGIQAAGKSTVAEALARRLPRSTHVRGDTMRRFVVNGRAEMSAQPSDAALEQLLLRYRAAAAVADAYAEAGFTTILQDVVLGEFLAVLTELIVARPLYVVVLAPRQEVVAAREHGREKVAYGEFTVADLDTVLWETTPRIGHWLDTSDLTVEQTVEAILALPPTES